MATKSLQLRIDSGMFSSGEPSEIPDGYCRSILNMLLRPNRLDSRHPFIYDSLMSITGLANFDDQTNKCSRQLSLASDQKVYEKATTGDTHSASLGTVGGTRLTDLTNYRGVAYGMMETSGVPAAAFSFDGTNLSTTPFNSAIQSRCITAYLDRNFLAYPRVTVTPMQAIASSYRFDDATKWLSPGGAIVPYAIGGAGTAKTYRLFPLNTAINPLSINGINGAGVPQFTVAASTTDLSYIWRQDYRATDPVKSITMRLVPTYKADYFRVVSTAYALGATVVENNIIYRVIVAGTTPNPLIALSTQIGVATVDGTVTWLAEHSEQLATTKFVVQPTSESPDWETAFCVFSVPWHIGTVGVIPTLRFAADDNTAVTDIIGVDVAYTDGLADGDPRKANKGLQITQGDFHFPFINTETATTATLDMNSIVWSDILQPKKIRASATYELREVPGFPTAAYLLGGRYLVHKRNAFWVFAGNTDSVSFDIIPIRKEDKKEGVGCIGPKAHDEIDNDTYFIGEDGVYRFTVGADAPEEIGGNAMREEITSRGANWVELQTTYNQPILRINKRDKEVFVYTQKGTIHVYNIARKGWTTLNVNVGGVAVEVADMIFNPNTRKMYIAFGGYGLARLDWSSAAATDTIDNTATPYNITKEFVTKPLETWAPRIDWVIDNIGVFHLATASQSGQTLTASVSTDRGSTYPWSDTVTLDLTIPRNEIPLFESAPTLMLKISHVGKTGPSVWSVSKLDAEVGIFGGEWPQTKPVSSSTTL